MSAGTLCDVIAGGINNYCGFLLAEGIWLRNCSESFVKDNGVNVTGASSFNSNAGSFILAFDDEQTAFDADIADINQVISQLTQGSISVTLGAAIVIGIKVTNYDDSGYNAVITTASTSDSRLTSSRRYRYGWCRWCWRGLRHLRVRHG